MMFLDEPWLQVVLLRYWTSHTQYLSLFAYVCHCEHISICEDVSSVRLCWLPHPLLCVCVCSGVYFVQASVCRSPSSTGPSISLSYLKRHTGETGNFSLLDYIQCPLLFNRHLCWLVWERLSTTKNKLWIRNIIKKWKLNNNSLRTHTQKHE